MRMRQNVMRNIGEDDDTIGERREFIGTPKTGTGSLSTSGVVPPPFDPAELGSYANLRGSQEVS
jgi:hypothetical protein